MIKIWATRNNVILAHLPAQNGCGKVAGAGDAAPGARSSQFRPNILCIKPVAPPMNGQINVAIIITPQDDVVIIVPNST